LKILSFYQEDLQTKPRWGDKLASFLCRNH